MMGSFFPLPGRSFFVQIFPRRISTVTPIACHSSARLRCTLDYECPDPFLSSVPSQHLSPRCFFLHCVVLVLPSLLAVWKFTLRVAHCKDFLRSTCAVRTSVALSLFHFDNTSAIPIFSFSRPRFPPFRWRSLPDSLPRPTTPVPRH